MSHDTADAWRTHLTSPLTTGTALFGGVALLALLFFAASGAALWLFLFMRVLCSLFG